MPSALRNRRRFAALLAIGLAVHAAAPVNAQSDWVERIVAAYRNPAPIHTDAGLTPSAAFDVQQRVVAALRPDLGNVFGYKAGLTSAAARERFGVDEPVLGTLLQGMILDDGARISLASGVRLLVEADLLARIGDERINRADTRREVLEALDRVAPFIEVPDVVIAQGQPVTGPVLTAVNSGARWGVMGQPILIDSLDAGRLATFTVRLERDGETVAESDGRALMNHPLEAALWMVRSARERGIVLQAGQWLSLGSLTPPVPAAAGQTYRAIYENLGEGSFTLRVGFVP